MISEILGGSVLTVGLLKWLQSRKKIRLKLDLEIEKNGKNLEEIKPKMVKFFISKNLPEGFKSYGKWDLPGHIGFICCEIDMVIWKVKVAMELI